jgi:hypothetical protein
MLCCKNKDITELNNIVAYIVDWGSDSRGAAGWFPGGLPAWQRMTSLLSETVALADVASYSYESKSVATKMLQILWETVYNALCNHTYFYSLPISDILAGSALSVLEQFEASAVDGHVVSIDLSKLMTLEAEHLKALADFRDKLSLKGWVLWLISEGKYTRRHLNVLEGLTRFVGALELHSSIYSAVTASQKIAIVGEDEYVSEI